MPSSHIGTGLPATLVRSILSQTDAASTWSQHARIVTQLAERFPAAAELLSDPALSSWRSRRFPRSTGGRSGPTIPQERLNKELRRRTEAVGIFPNRDAVLRLVGAVLAEHYDEWAVACRYISAESLAKTHVRVIDGDGQPEEVKELATVG